MLVKLKNLINKSNEWLGSMLKATSSCNVAFSLTGSNKKSKHLVAALLMLPLSAMANIDWVVNNDDAGASVPAGSNITYNVTVANNGSDPTPSTTLTLTIDPATTFVSAAGLVCAGTGPVTCTVPALAAAGSAGDSVNVAVVVNTSTLVTPVILGASVPTAGEVGGLPGNNVANEPTPVTAGADVQLVITGPASAQSGSMVTYVYTATNLGPSPSTGTILSIPKPTGLDNITTPAGCTLGGSTYTCNLSGLAVNGSSAINFTGQISAASPSTVSPQGTTVASGATPDPVAANNANTFNTTVTAGSDLRILKSSSPSGGTQLVGSAVTFTLTPSYTGDVPGAMTISDTIPSNYTIGAVASSQNGWTCGVAGQVVTCTKATGTVAGLNVALGAISIPTTAASAGAGIVNTATITGPVGQDPNAANNTASSPAMTLVDPTVDLRANKSGPSNPALVVVGNPYNFDISMTNIGTAAFFGTARMVDHLPAGLTVTGYTLNDGWTCSPAAPVVGGPGVDITCERIYTSGSPLGVGATTAAVTLNTTATGTGDIDNGLTVSSPNPNIADLNPSNDSITYRVNGANPAASADISVVKTIAHPLLLGLPTPSESGEEVWYKVEVVNFGSVTSNNVTLTDALQNLINSNAGPTGAGFISAVITPGVSTGGSCSSVANGATRRDLTCTFATIPVCNNGVDCPTVEIRVRPGGNADPARGNTASAISSTTHDPDLTNNADTITSVITAKVDVTVTKTGPASVPAGQDLTYVIAAQNVNNGMSSADNVTIIDTLPANLLFISATPSTGSCGTTPTANSTTGAGNNTINCNLGTIANGGQQTVTVLVRPKTALSGTLITNVVDVTTTTPELAIVDGGLTNQAFRPTIITVPVVGLFIDKVDNVDPVAVGDNVIYTVQVTNSGLSAAENVTVTDTLPTVRLNYISHTVPTGGSCGLAGNVLTCSVPYLAPGAVTNFTVTMQGIAKGVDNNVATVTSTEVLAGNGVADNSGGGETTTVRTKADMEVVSKTPSAATVNLNEPFSYVVKVRNNGPNEADDVVVSDNLPAGMQLTGAPVATVVSGTTIPAVPVACTGVAGDTALTCNLGTVNLAAVVDISVPVRVVSAGGVFNNTASVLTSSLDTNGGSNPTAGNNFKTVLVTVNKSSLAGEVYRDVNDDGIKSGAGETGIVGVQMQLTGTDVYGNAITRTATTNAAGAYLFDNLPQSNAAGYTVIEVAQPAGLTDGIETAGNAGGTPGANHTTDIISAIVLPANTAATGYLFGELPIPFIGVSKSAGATINNGDGTYTVPFTITVKNYGGTPLTNVQITDDLTGTNASGKFGTYVAGLPAAGEYTVNSAPVVTIQSNNAALTSAGAAFTGSGPGTGLLVPATSSLPDSGVAPAFAVASSATITFDVRFFPTTSGPFNNSAVANGTSPIGVVVTDNSVASGTPDPDGDGNPTNNTSPTVVTLDGQVIGIAKSVAAIKQTGTKKYQVPYSIVVANPGAVVTSTNVQVTDNLLATFPTAQTITISTPAAVSACTGTVLTVAAPAFTGTGQNNLLTGNQNLQAGERCTITFTAEVDFGTNALPAVVQNNQAIATTAAAPGGAVIATDLSDDGVIPRASGSPGNTDAPTPVSFAPAALAQLSGHVWLDTNHDRVLDAGETTSPLVKDWVVELLSGGVKITDAKTLADGSYSFAGLAPDTGYTIRFRHPTTGMIWGNAAPNEANLVFVDGVVGPNNLGGANNNDGTLAGITLVAGQNLVQQSLPIDPSGVVYNAVDRTPVGGAVVTITGPASFVPASHLVSRNANFTTGADGMYQFDLMPGAPAGTYTLTVTTYPAGYIQQPSTIIPVCTTSLTVGATPDPALVQNSNLAPATGVPAHNPTACPANTAGLAAGAGTTQYFTSFVFAAGSANLVNNHIPLDPLDNNMFVVTKTGNKTIAEIGDVVTYTVQARLRQGAFTQLRLIDNLPAGFRYIAGTATYALGSGASTKMSAAQEPNNLGPQLTFNIGAIPAVDNVTLVTVVYKVRVGVGSMQGDGVNRVYGVAQNGLTSNTAHFKVKVTGGVFTNDACVAGKVFVDCNNNHVQDAEELGIPGVRMYMEDGTYFISDVEGKYSYCGISPKTHVLKVDSLTMPRGSRLTITSNRNAGDANSLFLDTKNGELIRADFAEGSCSNTVLEQVKARRTGGEVRAPETEKKGGPAIKFEGKSPAYPQQGTDSANQRLVKPRGGAGDAPVSNTENDNPVQPLPESSGNTRGDNLRDQKGGAK